MIKTKWLLACEFAMTKSNFQQQIGRETVFKSPIFIERSSHYIGRKPNHKIVIIEPAQGPPISDVHTEGREG